MVSGFFALRPRRRRSSPKCAVCGAIMGAERTGEVTGEGAETCGRKRSCGMYVGSS